MKRRSFLSKIGGLFGGTMAALAGGAAIASPAKVHARPVTHDPEALAFLDRCRRRIAALEADCARQHREGQEDLKRLEAERDAFHQKMREWDKRQERLRELFRQGKLTDAKRAEL